MLSDGAEEKAPMMMKGIKDPRLVQLSEVQNTKLHSSPTD